MKKAKNIPNKEQALAFSEYMKKWQVLFGLMDWRIVLVDKVAPAGIMANVNFDPEARIAAVKLGDWRGTAITDEALESTAIHELLHVLMFDLTSKIPDSPHVDSGLIEHKIIHVLEKLLSTSGDTDGQT